MKRYVMIALLLVAGSSADLLARHPYRRWGGRMLFGQVHRYDRLSYEQRRHYLNARYPKYVGGFHASYFRDMGVAPGDVGLRGNSISLTPW